jgi:hypothetical protein
MQKGLQISISKEGLILLPARIVVHFLYDIEVFVKPISLQGNMDVL